jgi:hypothetical protein
MGEKLYRPILKDGDHLVQSTKNPDRVRGQSRDANNKNPDLIEWEPVEVEEQSDYEPIPYEERQVQLTPEEERLAREIGEALAAGTVWLIGNVVVPWWKKSAWPWVKGKFRDTVSIIKGETKIKAAQIVTEDKKQAEKKPVNASQLSSVSLQIDSAFEQFQFDMDENEAKEHMLKIVFHLLEIANEIRIMSNSQIKRECESEEQYLERVKASESYLTERVASNIDKLLSDDKLCIDVKTSKELFGLMGGGIRINGEYVPVELTKVHEAILAQDYEITER